jgi:hypothetical protein
MFFHVHNLSPDQSTPIETTLVQKDKLSAIIKTVGFHLSSAIRQDRAAPNRQKSTGGSANITGIRYTMIKNQWNIEVMRHSIGSVEYTKLIAP